MKQPLGAPVRHFSLALLLSLATHPSYTMDVKVDVNASADSSKQKPTLSPEAIALAQQFDKKNETSDSFDALGASSSSQDDTEETATPKTISIPTVSVAATPRQETQFTKKVRDEAKKFEENAITVVAQTLAEESDTASLAKLDGKSGELGRKAEELKPARLRQLENKLALAELQAASKKQELEKVSSRLADVVRERETLTEQKTELENKLTQTSQLLETQKKENLKKFNLFKQEKATLETQLNQNVEKLKAQQTSAKEFLDKLKQEKDELAEKLRLEQANTLTRTTELSEAARKAEERVAELTKEAEKEKEELKNLLEKQKEEVAQKEATLAELAAKQKEEDERQKEFKRMSEELEKGGRSWDDIIKNLDNKKEKDNQPETTAQDTTTQKTTTPEASADTKWSNFNINDIQLLQNIKTNGAKELELMQKHYGLGALHNPLARLALLEALGYFNVSDKLLDKTSLSDTNKQRIKDILHSLNMGNRYAAGVYGVSLLGSNPRSQENMLTDATTVGIGALVDYTLDKKLENVLTAGVERIEGFLTKHDPTENNRAKRAFVVAVVKEAAKFSTVYAATEFGTRQWTDSVQAG